MLSLLVLYTAGGVLLMLLALPLLLGKVKPNPFYGFRVANTLQNESTWYAVNKYFAGHLLAAGAVEALAAVALFFVPGISVDTYAMAVLGVFVLVFSAAMARTWAHMTALK